jgi:uncharacterized OsmC-like protein
METMRNTFERTVRALNARPEIGKKTASTRATVQDGYVCDIEDGRWRFTADLSEKAGGTAMGPDPGVLGRAALAGCLAMSYTRWAAVMEIPVHSLEVEVQADFDARGEYGFEDVPPSYSEVRYVVRIDSPASDEDVARLLLKAEAHTAWLHVFMRPMRVRRVVELTHPAEA